MVRQYGAVNDLKPDIANFVCSGSASFPRQPTGIEMRRSQRNGFVRMFGTVGVAVMVFVSAAPGLANSSCGDAYVDYISAVDVDPEREASVLADRILAHSAPDRMRLNARAGEIREVPAQIRALCPALSGVTLRSPPQGFLVNVDQDLFAALVTDGDEATARPPAREQFESLSIRRGLTPVAGYEKFSVFRLDPDYPMSAERLERYAFQYGMIPGVRYAEPNASIGDGTDIRASASNDEWHVEFRLAWGDCPSGCMEERWLHFAVTSAGVETLTDVGTEILPGFAPLLPFRKY